MNGIMLPLDMNTDPTLTQLLNSYFVENVSLIDGVLPARYGYRTSRVIDIHTKNGCDNTHNSVTVFGGQRDTAQGSFELGDAPATSATTSPACFCSPISASVPRIQHRIRSTTR
jgi:hypothetical protein